MRTAPRWAAPTWAPWRAMLRMAARDAWRHRARSALVIALVGLPVLVFASADVVVRSYHLSPVVAYQRANGAASVELSAAGVDVVVQNAAGTEFESGPALRGVPLCNANGVRQRCASVAAARRALGAGAQVVARNVQTDLDVRTPAGLATARLVGVDYAGPVAAGIARQVNGRAPRSAGEVAVTPALASDADVHIGSTLRTISPTRRYTVVGIVADATSARVAEAFSVPGATADATVEPDFLARTPGPVTWGEVERLNRQGWVVQSRDVVAHPPPASEVGYRSDGATSRFSRTVEVSGVLLVGMALLEVILLAGPAFAVMARRQERTLAIVGTVGGRRRDLRNAVLAHGVILGGSAGIAGVVLGVLVGRLAEPVLASHASHRFGPLSLHPFDLIGIALVSLATALAAAVMPARAASATDVVAALAGRRPRRPARARVPIVAVLVAGLGVLVALAGAAKDSSATVPILAGIGLVELGLVIAAPSILVVVTRLGRWLPLGPRLALRDAGRNRSSAAPAVAAVMAAVIGCVAVLLGVAAQNAMERRTYFPQARPGQVTFNLGQLAGGSAQVVAAMRSALPTANVQVISAPGGSCADCDRPSVELAAVAAGERTSRYKTGFGGTVAVVDPSSLRALTGVDDPTAEAALRAGHAVVVDAWAVEGDVTSLQIQSFPPNGPERIRTVRVPAVAVPDGFAAAQVFMPPSLAQRIGVGSSPSEVLADETHAPSRAEREALGAALGAVAATHPLYALGATQPTFYVESGWHYRDEARLLLALLAAAVVAVGAAAIATGLSNADRTEDLAVLEAVGAGGRTRRLVSVSRAGVIAGVGVVLGTVAGFVPALGWIISRNRGVGSAPYALHLTIPWMPLAAVVVGIPAVAALLAGIFSRSRLTVGRAGVPRPGGTP